LASEVSRPHPTLFLLVGAFEGHGVPSENKKNMEYLKEGVKDASGCRTPRVLK
jgi:hypothetical protein